MNYFNLKTHEGPTFKITADQAEAIHGLLNAGTVSIKVNLENGKVFYLARGNYKGMDPYKEPAAMLAGGPPKALELTDAQRAANLKKLAEMKRDFLKRQIGARA